MVVERNTAANGVHQPLVDALRSARRIVLPAGHTLFHGCLDTDQDIDPVRQQLRGTRKWVSENPLYAAGYGFRFGSRGKPLLWRCRLATEVVAIVASQSELHKCGPWLEPSYTAPWMFPSGFQRHAHAALGSEVPVVFADHERDGRFQEILVPDPERLLASEEVHTLPSAKEAAKRFAESRYGG